MFARRTLTALLPVAALLTSACTEDDSTPEPGLPITTAQAAQTADANLSALLGAVIDQMDVVVAQPRHAWMLAMMGGSDAEDLEEVMARPQAEALRDELVRTLRERVLVEANLEPAAAGEAENTLTYRLPADVMCDAEAGSEDDCDVLLESMPLRIQVISHAEGQVELSALVGPNRNSVATLTLTAAAADLAVDLGELRAAAESLPEETRDDVRRKVPIATGRLDFSLAVNDGAITFGAEIAEALHLRVVPDPTTFEARVEPASFSATLDGARIAAAVDFNGATVEVEDFEPLGSPVPVAVALTAINARFALDLLGATLEAKFVPAAAQLLTLRQNGREALTFTATAEGDAPLGGVLSVLDETANQLRFAAFSPFSVVAKVDGLVLDGDPARDGEARVQMSDAAKPTLLFDDEANLTTLEAGRLTFARVGDAPTSLVPGECGVTETRMGDEWLGEVMACPAQ